MRTIMTKKRVSKRPPGLNKKDLTEKLAVRAGIPKTKATQYINILTGLISEALVDGKKVTISDFGTFNLSTRQSFKGFNPQNNEHIIVPQRIIPVFRAGKHLKNSLNFPFIKDCALASGKKLAITFSKPLLKDCSDVIQKSKYSIFIDGKKQTITNIQVDKKSQSDIQSVQLTTKNKLFEGDLSVVFHGILEGTMGNSSEGDILWPRD
jgi:DNA-binding protein HU-beta